MLEKLSISNYAIIEHSEIHFKTGFTVITGETGAGKSILLGALSLILGYRADSGSILDQNKKSVIEGFFNIKKSLFYNFFLERDLDFEEQTIIRRELLPNGKSRAFINDSPVNLEILRSFTSQLVDLHQQHESLSITLPDFQRSVVDRFAGHIHEVQIFSKQFSDFKKQEQLLAEKIAHEKDNIEKKDFLEFQLQELKDAEIKVGETEQIEKELQLAMHAGSISNSIQSISMILQDEESGCSVLLKKCVNELSKISKLNDDFQILEQRLRSALIEIEDIQHEISSYENIPEIDEEKIAYLNERTDLLNRLFQKHQTINDEELLRIQSKLEEELSDFESTSEEILEIRKSLSKKEEDLIRKADSISKNRHLIKERLEQKIKALLVEVGMPKAQFKIDIEKQDEFNSFGKDQIQFLFSANSGQPLKELSNVASGGELSRLMLAIKTTIADQAILPILIFDEIDTGISGETAKKIGKLLKKLSNHHQIISITHLPQIAAKGDNHLKVIKKETNGTVFSHVINLGKEKRIVEIAEMLSGANPSDTALVAAKELLD